MSCWKPQPIRSKHICRSVRRDDVTNDSNELLGIPLLGLWSCIVLPGELAVRSNIMDIYIYIYMDL